MTALTAPQLIIYRKTRQWREPYLDIDNPPIVFQARINQASFTYPIAAFINWDTLLQGSSANVILEQLVVFGSTAGDDDLGRTVIRGVTGVSSGQFSIPRCSQGTEDGTVNLTDNAYITVYDSFPVFAKHPYIDKQFSVTYKDGDRAFNGDQYPIANLGHGCMYSDIVTPSTNLITVTFDSTTAFAAHPGATITSRLWDIGDGSYVVGGSTSTIITATFPVGRRHVTLLVGDSEGNFNTRRILVRALKEGTAYAPIFRFKPGSLQHRFEGKKFSFRILQDLPESSYPDGVPVCYFEKTYSGDEESNLTGTVVRFSGYHHIENERVTATRTHIQPLTTIECLDVAGKLATLPAFPQVVERTASPNRWEQMAAPDMDRYLAYLWLWHSTAPTVCDFTWSGTTTTYPFVRLGSNGGNLYDQIDVRAKAIGYRLLSDARGRMQVKKDSMLFDAADRDNTNIIDLGEDDWAMLGWRKQRSPKYHWHRGYAVVASTTDVAGVMAIAPGETPSQGSGSVELNEALVVDQTEWNKRLGHTHARQNAKYSYFEIALPRGNFGDVFELGDFVRLTMTSETAAKRGLTFTNQRCMIVEMNEDPDDAAGRARLRLTLEVETFGLPATTVYPDPDPLPQLLDPEAIYPIIEVVQQGIAELAAFDTDGTLWITGNYNIPSASGGPVWTSQALSISGQPLGFVVDAYSPKLLTGSGAVNGWLVTRARIYRITDIFGTVGVTSQFIFRAVLTEAGGRSIDASFSVQNWVVVSSYYATDSAVGDRGAWTTYTTDGSTWATEQQHSSTTANYFHQYPGLHVSSKVAGLAYTTYMTGSPGDGPVSAGLRTVDYGANWSALSSPNLSGINLAFDLHAPFHDNPSDTMVYRGLRDKVTNVQKLLRVNGATQTDITPFIDGKGYTMDQHGRSTLVTNPTNRQRLVMCASHNDDLAGGASHVATFASMDAGDSWIVLDGPLSAASPRYRQCSITDNNVIFLWGMSGQLGICTDFATIDERGPGGSGRIVGITGNG